MPIDDMLRELAAGQHGLVANRQAFAMGLSPEGLRHRLARGDWTRASSRVIALVGAPSTSLRPHMLAALHHGPDAFVSHVSALAAWGLPGFDLREQNVIVRRGRNRDTPVGRVHSSTTLTDRHITSLQGVPIVTPIRAIFDVAGIIHPGRVERALDNAWARRLISYALLQRTLEELARRGRPGIAIMRELAEARPADYRPPGSNTERRVNDLLDQASQRRLRRQVNAGNERDWIGRVDLVDDELPLIVEVQTELFHGSKADAEADRIRIAKLRAAGFEVVEVWESDAWRDGDVVVQKVMSARRRLQKRLAA
jgi:very-short-patch-repair endonuclease